ncbi:hypothetical protein LQZ18_08730 [Lachnospiraceae bacterium ZAX-1]
MNKAVNLMMELQMRNHKSRSEATTQKKLNAKLYTHDKNGNNRDKNL